MTKSHVLTRQSPFAEGTSESGTKRGEISLYLINLILFSKRFLPPSSSKSPDDPCLSSYQIGRVGNLGNNDCAPPLPT